MIHHKWCEFCGFMHYERTVCDTCGQNVSETNVRVGLRVRDTDYHFCNYQCLSKYIIEQLKHESKDDRFIYGEEKE